MTARHRSTFTAPNPWRPITVAVLITAVFTILLFGYLLLNMKVGA